MVAQLFEHTLNPIIYFQKASKAALFGDYPWWNLNTDGSPSINLNQMCYTELAEVLRSEYLRATHKQRYPLKILLLSERQNLLFCIVVTFLLFIESRCSSIYQLTGSMSALLASTIAI
jgi:hypothetical protein